MPRTEEKYIVALDIGTSKVCVLVGEVNDRNQIEIIGKGTSPMKGTRRGNIINLDQAIDAVKKAVDEAEVMAGLQIESVYVGLAGDHTNLWWDVRPHPRLGTLEIRMPDQPTAVARSGAFAALLQALCVAVLEAPPRPYDPAARGIYQQNRWAALRFGPRAELIHPDGERLLPVPELTYELLGLIQPAVEELGTVELIRRLEPTRCEGDRQLEVGRADTLEAVVADVAERTVSSK